MGLIIFAYGFIVLSPFAFTCHVYSVIRRVSLQNKHKTLNLYYKTDLDFWVCFLKGEYYLTAELVKTYLNISGHSKWRRVPSYNRIITVIAPGSFEYVTSH